MRFFKCRKLDYIMNQFAAAKSHRINLYFKGVWETLLLWFHFLKDINWKVISCHICSVFIWALLFLNCIYNMCYFVCESLQFCIGFLSFSISVAAVHCSHVSENIYPCHMSVVSMWCFKVSAWLYELPRILFRSSSFINLVNVFSPLALMPSTMFPVLTEVFRKKIIDLIS